jgi:hypothetical protein
MNNKLWLLIALMGCGGDGSGSANVNVEDPSAFCRAVAETGCDTMYACLTPQERAAKNLPPTVAECERKLESGCENAVDACNDGEHGYASAAAGMCLDEMVAATCNDAGEPWLDAPSCAKICARTAGSFQIKWAFSPSWHSCSELAIQTVAVHSVGAGGKTYVDEYDCYAGSGITDALPIGTYSVHLELFNASHSKVWTGVAMPGQLDRELVDLGTVTIPVSSQ